jgi:hypothetical protein
MQHTHALREPQHVHARIALCVSPLEPGKSLIPVVAVCKSFRNLKRAFVRSGFDEFLQCRVRLRVPPLRVIDVREREQTEICVNLAFCRLERLVEGALVGPSS